MTDPATEPTPPPGELTTEPAGELTAAERLAIALGTASPEVPAPAPGAPEPGRA
jgi:hypothetical protein